MTQEISTEDNAQFSAITSLAEAFTNQVPANATFTTVFNAIAAATVAFVIDYVMLSGKELTEANVAEELQKISAMTVAQADYLINTVDIASKVKRPDQSQ